MFPLSNESHLSLLVFLSNSENSFNFSGIVFGICSGLLLFLDFRWLFNSLRAFSIRSPGIPPGRGAQGHFLRSFDFSEKWKPLKTIIFGRFKPWDHEIPILRIKSFQIGLDPAKFKSSRKQLIFWKSRGLKSIIFAAARLPDPHKQIRLEESFKMM